jgi:RNA polymerase sigma-70 factor, ECF subfamily
MDDAAVIARFRETGDRAIFGVLVERYQHRVHRLIAGVLGPNTDADAEEVCQDVFLRVFRKLDLFTGEASFGTWLYRVAYNLALDERRKGRSRPLRLSLDSVVETSGRDEDPLAALQSRERRDRLAAAIERLPDLYRTTIHLHYWLELSIEEIAASLTVPEGTVKSYLFRARRMLKSALSGEGGRGRAGRPT